MKRGFSINSLLKYLLMLGLIICLGLLLPQLDFSDSKYPQDPYSANLMSYPMGFDKEILYQDLDWSSTTSPPMGQRLDGMGPADPSSTTPGSNSQKELVLRSKLDLIRQFEKGSEKKLEKTRDGKYFKVTFDMLSGFEFYPDFDFIMGRTSSRKPLPGRIPERVIGLNDKPVVLIGFMVPIHLDGATMKVRSFALSQNLAFCCYGVMPNLHELVMADVRGNKEAPFYDNIPVAVFGTLSVGEEVDRAQMVSFYRLKVDEVLHLKELLKRVEQ